MYGTQTIPLLRVASSSFENDVKMYGTQTVILTIKFCCEFENDVKMYGTQTTLETCVREFGLRMM